MSTRARKVQQAKATKVAERKRKAEEIEKKGEGSPSNVKCWKDAMEKAVQERHERDVDTRNKQIRGDNSFTWGTSFRL